MFGCLVQRLIWKWNVSNFTTWGLHATRMHPFILI